MQHKNNDDHILMTSWHEVKATLTRRAQTTVLDRSQQATENNKIIDVCSHSHWCLGRVNVSSYKSQIYGTLLILYIVFIVEDFIISLKSFFNLEYQIKLSYRLEHCFNGYLSINFKEILVFSLY